MTAYILLMVSVSFAVWNNCLYHNLRKKSEVSSNSATYFFSSVSGLISLIILLCYNGGFGMISLQTLVWGIVYGVAMSIFLVSKMRALSYGDIAITTLIGNYSLIIPTMFGIIYYGEKVSVFQIIGFVFILLAIFLCSNLSKEKSIMGRKWIFWCVMFFVANGLVSVVFKLHQASKVKNQINEMMIIAYAASCILLFVAAFVENIKNSKIIVKAVFKKEIFIYVLLCAVTCTVYNRINIYLTGVLPSIVFFPLFNCGVIILVSLLGIALYKEKLNLRQASGILVGIMAILFIGVF